MVQGIGVTHLRYRVVPDQNGSAANGHAAADATAADVAQAGRTTA